MVLPADIWIGKYLMKCKTCKGQFGASTCNSYLRYTVMWEPAGGWGVIFMCIAMDIKTNTICHVCICMVVYEEV